MFREESIKKHLRDGLEGNNFRDTFLLHLSSAVLILVIGLSVHHYLGIDRLLKITPILVGILVLLEYAIGWLPWLEIYTKVRELLGFNKTAVVPMQRSLIRYENREPITSWIAPQSIKAKGVLSINLTSGQLSESREKLHHIYLLYSECHYLLDSSHQSRDVRVASIETERGNVRAKLFGEHLVISLVTSLIESTVTQLSVNHLRGGKQTDISSLALESIVNLEAKLRESGADTNAMRDQIRKSSVRISQQLNELLANESVVKVDEKVFPINEEHLWNVGDKGSMIVLGTKPSQ